jgi:hypothetical protein
MRFRGLALLPLLAASFAPAPAGAQFWGPPRPQAPWCAVYSLGLGETRWECIYPSLKSCVPTILAGTRGFCNPNPRYQPPEPRRHRRKH